METGSLGAIRESRPLRVVLIEPLGDDFKPSLNTKGNSLEPVSLEWLAAYVDHHAPGSYDVKVIQQRDMADSALLRRIKRIQPDIVGLSMLTQYEGRCRYIARELKRHRSDILIVVGGQHPSILPEVVLNPEFDVAVLGEGEVTFLEVLEAWKAHLNSSANRQSVVWSSVANSADTTGTAFELDGDLKLTKLRPRVTDLDGLPWPRRDPALLMECRQWNISYPCPAKQRNVAQVSWSRGCSGRCSFCISHSVWKGDQACSSVVSRSADSVIREMLYLKEEFGTNFVYFNDLSFNNPVGGHEALMTLCKAMELAGLHNPASEEEKWHIPGSIHWFALCKVGISDEEAKAMADAGCSKVGIGVESASADVVKNFRKSYGQHPDEASETLKNTDNHGIINRAYMIIGSPTDPANIQELTLDYLLKNPIDQVRLAFFTPYPGTEAWDKCSDRMLTLDFSELSQERPVVRCDHFTAEQLEDMKFDIPWRFYTNEEYLSRCEAKVRRFPRLRDSFNWHFGDLEEKFAEHGKDINLPRFL